MTQEQQHIFEYLKVVLTENWDNLSNTAKCTDTSFPFKNVKELIKEIQSDTNSLEWYFTECLGLHIEVDGERRDILEELLVYEDDEFNVYEVNGKFIKVWYEKFDAQFQFVERKDFDMEAVNEDLQSIIAELRKENELLKLKIEQLKNEN